MTVADPTVLTVIIGTVAGVIGAATPIIIERRNGKRSKRDEIEDAAEESIASWGSLNEALGREIQRLHGDLERQRADYQAVMDKQRADYEAQLDAARKRITDLETDVASLQRLIGQQRQ
jgi:gas vesicle protein